MCYDVSFTSNVKDLPQYFPDLVFDPQLKFDLDVDRTHIIGYDYKEHPILRRNREGELVLELMEWGCIPYYTKNIAAFARQRPTMLNARSERILDDNKAYWFKIKNRRCLTPVNGIYEHRAIAGWKKKCLISSGQKIRRCSFCPGCIR